MNFEIAVLFCISFILRTQFRGVSCEELYMGCYTHFSGLSINKNPIQSVSQCLTECRSQISSFAAIKDGSSCYCGNITNTRVPSSNCNLTCSVNSGRCGGNNLFAVYTDIPTYRGCFKDYVDNRDMIGTIIDDFGMTMDKCYEKCLSLNYRFMGAASGGSCFCGQQFGKHGRAPESDCNMTCTGDGNQICGGFSRNSVYTVGYLLVLNKSYSQVFHCLNGATDMHGTCTSKTCQPGWKGTKCNQRDCMLNNGNCGEHKCEETTIGNQIISECVCKEGFRSISIYDECTDIDECQNNPCNEPSETCINTIGSFMCNCSRGYNNISRLSCDVQCIAGLPQCQNVTSCEKIQNYTCLSKEFDKSSDWTNGNITPDKRDAIILATFLTFSLCTQIFLISAVIYYKRKNKKLAISVREQSTDAMTDSTYKQLDFSSQSLDDHNYSELTNNEKK